MPGTTHQTGLSSRSHAQNAKHPAISAIAATISAAMVGILIIHILTD